MNQLRVGTELRLTQDLRCLLGDSLLAELHDQQYKLHLRYPRFHSVYYPAVFESMI